jgi:DNA transformation protein
MSLSPEFRDFLVEHFSELGPVSVRRMFGGAGLYLHGVIFALVINEVVYLKTSEATRPLFEAEGSEPFTYEKKTGKSVSLRYWRIPEAAMDDPEEAALWARRALAAGD